MADELTTLFDRFDRGVITRRQLLQTLGIAAVAAPLTKALGQGSCGGQNAGTPRCDTTAIKPLFEPTGWHTVLLDRFTMQVVDYQKEAAYYNALMGWKIRSDDGKQAVLDIGDFGSMVIRGGLEVPPSPPAPPVTDTAAGRGGRGRGGRGGPPRAIWDSFCWGIDPWDAKNVEAELRKRGLDPVAENDPKNDFYSFHVKDPDGFDVQISNGNKKNRRTSASNGKLSMAAPFESTGWKTVWLDHISFAVTSYKRSTSFYTNLLGWKPTGDEGSQNECQIGEVGNIIIRGGNELAPPGSTGGRSGGGQTRRGAVINHCAFGISPWDPDKVKAELDKRGLSSSVDTGGKGSTMDALRVAEYQSFHTTTPNGYNLQISKTTRETRNTR